MKNLRDIKKAYFIGIGGIGMSALARYFHIMGIEVSGYDKSATLLTDSLMMDGIEIHFQEDIDLIPAGIDLVVYTAAIPKDHKELLHFIANKYEVKKRAEVLGMIAKRMFNISVAGSHGKTTVSTMIGHLLKATGYDCTAFLGGVSVNYNSNLLVGENDLVVVEADEYDRSFLQLFPNIAVVTAIDSDHLDVYGSIEEIVKTFRDFVAQISSDGTLIAKYNLLQMLDAKCDETITYALDERQADIFLDNYSVTDGSYAFDVSIKGEVVPGFKLQVGGVFNIENALAAIAVGNVLGLDMDEIKEAMYQFKGIKRRFEVIYTGGGKVFIDDYAHHPREIDVLLQSVKELYPGKKITVVFQPHLYSRTRDLAEAFAESLGGADELFLLDIYPARELPIPGVNSTMILDKVQTEKKRQLSKQELVKALNIDQIDVLLTVGAGDIDQLIYPIKKMFEENETHLA